MIFDLFGVEYEDISGSIYCQGFERDNKIVNFYHLKEEEKDGSTVKKLEFIYYIELEEEIFESCPQIISETNKYAAFSVGEFENTHFYIYDL